jgi:hypothetical protein
MAWFEVLRGRIGLGLCRLGWHRQPFQKEPRPRGLTPEEYRFREMYRCARCGLVGRIDGHGNLDPELLAAPGSAAEALGA